MKKEELLKRQRLMLSRLANQSQYVKDTKEMILISERNDGGIISELIASDYDTMLSMLGTVFINLAKASGAIENQEWEHISLHIEAIMSKGY